jgi:hypothetical protein
MKLITNVMITNVQTRPHPRLTFRSRNVSAAIKFSLALALAKPAGGTASALAEAFPLKNLADDGIY